MAADGFSSAGTIYSRARTLLIFGCILARAPLIPLYDDDDDDDDVAMGCCLSSWE